MSFNRIFYVTQSLINNGRNRAKKNYQNRTVKIKSRKYFSLTYRLKG